MILFLYGPDSYRSLNKLKEIVLYYQKTHKSGLNLIFFEKEKLDFERFEQVFSSSAMFDEKKLIILKNIFSDKDFKEKFFEKREKFLTDKKIILIYEEKEISQDDKLFRFFKKKAKCQEFKPLEGEKLKKWIQKEFSKSQSKIENKALDMLIDFVGNNLWQMSNEIQKLISYKKDKTITSNDVKLLVKPKIESDIFKTIDAISAKRKSLALNLIHRHLKKGEDPLYLLAMMNFQFRNLLMAKSSYFHFSKLKLHPFVIKKTLWQTKNFSLEELKKIYQTIFQIDLKVKTGKIEPALALDLLIAEI